MIDTTVEKDCHDVSVESYKDMLVQGKLWCNLKSIDEATSDTGLTSRTSPMPVGASCGGVAA